VIASPSLPVSDYVPGLVPGPRPEGNRVLPSEFADWPRSTIIVDEWGPYDWKAPKLWPTDSSLSTPLKLRVLGPGRGSWRVMAARGASVSKMRGTLGDTIEVTPSAAPVEDWTVTLSNGEKRFSYSRFDTKPNWDVKVYVWTDSTHPLNATPAFAALLRGERAAPVLSLAPSRLDYVWFRPPVIGWPLEKVGVLAATTVELPGGSYTLRTISDDGIRVFVDDRQVIEDWTVHESRVLEAPMSAGRRRIRVEYFQLDGWTELRAEIIKQPQ